MGLVELLSALADTSALVKFASASVIGLSLGGVFPRVGAGRAITLNLKSRFFHVASPKSVRRDEVQSLRNLIAGCETDQYIVKYTPPPCFSLHTDNDLVHPLQVVVAVGNTYLLIPPQNAPLAS